MWLNETLIALFGMQAPLLDQLPLRIRALLDVATKAGLGDGRTKSGVLVVLRGQSSLILRQWQMQNVKATHVNDGGQPSMNGTDVVALLVDQQQDFKETRLVSSLHCFISI